MMVTFNSATISSLRNFINSVVNDSNLSFKIKNQVMTVTSCLTTTIQGSSESDFHRSCFNELTQEHEIEIDEDKIILLLETFVRYQSFFVPVFNIFANSFMSFMAVRRMVLTMPQRVGHLGNNLVDDIGFICHQPSRWKSRLNYQFEEINDDSEFESQPVLNDHFDLNDIFTKV